MTRIAVVEIEADMFWQSVGRLLRTDDRTEILHVKSLAELSIVAKTAPIDVAIVPWSRAGDGYPWLERFGRPRVRAAIGLDGTTNEAVLWAREINFDLLRRLSELFGGALAVAGQTDRPAQIGPMQEDPVPDRPRALLVWAELLVRARLVALPPDPIEAPSIPGWTAGLEQVRSLMGARSDDDAASLHRAIEQNERELGSDTFWGDGGKIALNRLERRSLALALAPEIDGRFHFAYGYLHNDLTRIYATESVIADILAVHGTDSVDVMRAVRDGAIARFGLLEAEPGAEGRTGPESPQRVPHDLQTLLLTGALDDSTIEPGLRLENYPAAAIADDDAAHELMGASKNGWVDQIVQLVGSRPAGDWAGAILSSIGYETLVVDVTALEVEPHDSLRRAASRIARIAKVSGAVPVLVGARHGGRIAQDLATLVARRNGIVLLDLERPWTPPAPFAACVLAPFANTRPISAADWQDTGRRCGIEIMRKDAAELAATRRDDPGLVAAVCRHLAASLGEGAPAGLDQLRSTAKALSAPPDDGLVRRIEPSFGWDDIVLPKDRLQSLKQITEQVRHAAQVMHDWHYAQRMPLGQGVAALFAGSSGTGKTMAAQVIAADLGVEIFHIDLAKTVSKYIGETEKHLNSAFAAAERASAVLLFDEADALFGKRTEVKDAHDRYANVEIAYLLQRLEEFRGVVILTTNFKQNMDAAFLRRLRTVLDFPSPDAAQRLKIWKQAAPKAAPGWKELDFTYLAERFQLTGGHIQQISVTAAFLAASEHMGAAQDDRFGDAEDKPKIEMKHVMRATRQQLVKLGMVSAGKTLPDDEPVTSVRSA